ncbi:MAG: hypothetical protein PHC69_08365 [Ruminiclostridium sp.]|nr:hypothetical protein [Ruminiclostridium sp.]
MKYCNKAFALQVPSHRAASAAKRLGSDGPVRRNRKSDTLYKIPR